jgi:glutamate-5-semialdehyde dehydrogenase
MEERSTPKITDLEHYCESLARRARSAAQRLATANGAEKNEWLRNVACALLANADQIIGANEKDLSQAAEAGLSDSTIERLKIDPSRLRAMADGLNQVAALPDPVGRVLDSNRRPNGLQVLKVSVPLGVIFFIYESRPNVTVDAAALCLKSGNAIILRGGKEAFHSNMALCKILREGLIHCGLPEDAVQQVETVDRAAVGYLLRLDGLIDLAIPRGGESLIRRVAEEAAMPVLKHYKGNCHVYIDRAADLDMAERLVINAKCQRPSVCNAAESLLVHREIAAAFLPRIGRALQERKVELRGCDLTRQYIPDARAATEEDFAAEYLDLIASVKVVGSLEEAIEHINNYGSQHTDAIVTSDLAAARRFTEAVDSSAVMVNASTRFNDGYEFGLGAEIGISTDKIHARGPCGLNELTSYKYVVYGDGHLRGVEQSEST